MAEVKKRRNKKEVLISKIEMKNKKIASYQEKIDLLNLEKEDLESQLNDFIQKELKEKEEAETKALMSFIKKNNITKEQIESLIAVTEEATIENRNDDEDVKDNTIKEKNISTEK